jgi:son of sevenless-like protein
MASLGALQSAAVHRLKKTLLNISRSRRRQYEELTELMSHSSNSKNYRETLCSIEPPLVPFLGNYLSDLTFIEDGNDPNLPSGFINFIKRRMTAKILSEIQHFQQVPYNILMNEAVLEFLSQHPMNEEIQYQMSLHLEPRR